MSPDRSQQHVDRWLEGARATWQGAAQRDDERERAASERRLASAAAPHARRPGEIRLAYALAFACAVLVAIALRRSGDAPAEIHAEHAAPIAVPSVAAPAVETAPAAAPAPAPAAAPTASASALPPLPPLPPLPAPEPTPSMRKAKARADRAELRAATREIARGEVGPGREHLRALVRRADSSVIYDAARTLAESYEDPGDELAVWDESLGRIDGPAYRALAERARARALRDLDAGARREKREKREKRETDSD